MVEQTITAEHLGAMFAAPKQRALWLVLWNRKMTAAYGAAPFGANWIQHVMRAYYGPNQLEWPNLENGGGPDAALVQICARLLLDPGHPIEPRRASVVQTGGNA